MGDVETTVDNVCYIRNEEKKNIYHVIQLVNILKKYTYFMVFMFMKIIELGTAVKRCIMWCYII